MHPSIHPSSETRLDYRGHSLARRCRRGGQESKRQAAQIVQRTKDTTRSMLPYRRARARHMHEWAEFKLRLWPAARGGQCGAGSPMQKAG